MTLESFKSQDIVRRTFLKPRGEALVEYNFTTHAGIFHRYDGDDHLLKALINYVTGVFMDGYTQRDLGCSDSAELVGVEIQEHRDPELLWNTHQSDYHGKSSRQHITVQDFLLKNDPTIICYELPVWNDERSGFVDLIRYKDNQIFILDFKPRSASEKVAKVGSQMLRYRELLQFQLQCDPKLIRCVYFDDSNAYEVKFS